MYKTVATWVFQMQASPSGMARPRGVSPPASFFADAKDPRTIEFLGQIL